MNIRGKKSLHNVHSSIIALLTLAGLYINGWGTEDWFFLAATIYWIYQPVIEGIEERVVDFIADQKDNNDEPHA